MPQLLFNLEFLNHNAQRRYPLAVDATAKDQSGQFVLPDDVLLELDLPVHVSTDTQPDRFFLWQVGAFESGYSFLVGYQPPTGDPVPVASALVPRTVHTPYRVYALAGIEPYDDTLGKIVVGRLDTLDMQPAGLWTFDLAGGRLDPDAVRPVPRGVSALVLVNGRSRSRPLRGHIELIAGRNVRLTPVRTATSSAIRIDAASDATLTEECVCTDAAEPGPPIRSINGVRPDATGNIDLVAGECVSIVAETHGLRITDTCSRPCCGCEELEVITRDLKRLSEQAAGAQAFLNELREAVTAFDTIVLGSKVNDRGCRSEGG